MNFLWSYHRDIALYDELMGLVDRQQQQKAHFPGFLFKLQEGKNGKLLNFFGIQPLLLPLYVVLASTRIL